MNSFAQAGNVLQWESARQTQSTCEAELMAYNEGYQAGEAMSALLTTMGIEATQSLRYPSA